MVTIILGQKLARSAAIAKNVESKNTTTYTLQWCHRSLWLVITSSRQWSLIRPFHPLNSLVVFRNLWLILMSKFL
jgi:hypothetical protein